MSETEPDIADASRTSIAAWGTMIVVLIELVVAVGFCVNLQVQTIRQVADLGTELPKATELCLKIGMPGLVLIGAVVGAIVVTVNLALSDWRTKVLTNLVAATLIAGGGVLFYLILQLPFQVIGVNDLSYTPIVTRCYALAISVVARP